MWKDDYLNYSRTLWETKEFYGSPVTWITIPKEGRDYFTETVTFNLGFFGNIFDIKKGEKISQAIDSKEEKCENACFFWKGFARFMVLEQSAGIRFEEMS